MSHYKHFTTKEREKILFFLAQEKTISFIAKELQRDKSSVSREIKRNTNTEGIYSPSYAHKQYEIRRRKCGRKPLLLNADIHKTVQFLFLQYQWSSEQISFRLKHEKNPIQISYATIYRWIYRWFLEEGKLSPGQRGVARKLRHRGKTRHKNGCIETRGKIKISHHISERPEQANQRERIGDWEADTVAGVTGKACLVTLVDRKSRYLLCEKVAKKDSISVKQAIIHMLKDSRPKTITPDRGKEFSRHEEISKVLNDVQFYFPEPHQPWQRGTNENTNGLLREYFPKKQDLTEIKPSLIRDKALILNQRPRKCLNWKSPFEAYFDISLHLTWQFKAD